jgi:hypothetical protein
MNGSIPFSGGLTNWQGDLCRSVSWVAELLISLPSNAESTRDMGVTKEGLMVLVIDAFAADKGEYGTIFCCVASTWGEVWPDVNK